MRLVVENHAHLDLSMKAMYAAKKTRFLLTELRPRMMATSAPITLPRKTMLNVSSHKHAGLYFALQIVPALAECFLRCGLAGEGLMACTVDQPGAGQVHKSDFEFKFRIQRRPLLPTTKRCSFAGFMYCGESHTLHPHYRQPECRTMFTTDLR